MKLKSIFQVWSKQQIGRNTIINFLMNSMIKIENIIIKNSHKIETFRRIKIRKLPKIFLNW